MAEYIERDKIGLTDFEINICNGDYKEGLKMLLYKIESIRAADVRPVVRGKWDEEHEPFTWMGYTRWSCSCCGFKCGYELEIKSRTNFCPNCGADMREES